MRKELQMQGSIIGALRHGAREDGRILSVVTKIGTGYYLYRMDDRSSEFIHGGNTGLVSQIREQHSFSAK